MNGIAASFAADFFVSRCKKREIVFPFFFHLEYLPRSPRSAVPLTIFRDEFGTFLSKWRDYQFKVANSASSSSTAAAAAATAVSASSTPRKIICNKIVIYVRVPGKRAAQTLHSALRPSSPSSSCRLLLVVRGYAEVEDDGNDIAVNAFRRTLTFPEDYIILGNSSENIGNIAYRTHADAVCLR